MRIAAMRKGKVLRRMKRRTVFVLELSVFGVSRCTDSAKSNGLLSAPKVHCYVCSYYVVCTTDCFILSHSHTHNMCM
jgi:hypothetical protein